MPTYYSIITNSGLIKHADAANNAVNLDLTQMAVGDSNGVYYDPDGSEVALQNELHRVALTHVVIDENNTNQLIIEAVLDEIVGPFYVREVGIFDSNGDLFAIGKFPETFKPNLPSGSGKRLYIRMVLGFASSPNVNLIINNDVSLDPNFSTDVNNALAERLIKTNNLSDLNDISITRDNLGLGSSAVSDLATNQEAAEKTANDKVLTPANLAELVGIRHKKIFETPISSVANIDITNLSSEYDAYLFKFINIRPVNDSVEINSRVSTDNGVSFISSATYSYSNHRSMDTSYQRNTAATANALFNGIGNVGAVEQSYIDVIMLNPNAPYGRMDWQGSFSHRDNWVSFFGGSGRNSTGANVNAVRFYFSAGNFAASGKLKVYGVNYD
ncbi:phage tail protein [Rickettsiales bacterium]|nr:phage tail protein [Rickettsiales bacterium]